MSINDPKIIHVIVSCDSLPGSIDGTMELKNLNKNGLAKTENFLNFRDDDNLTHNWDKWYTSFDIAPDGMTLVTGDNSGFCTLLTYDGEVIWRDKLHKNKVTNIGK